MKVLFKYDKNIPDNAIIIDTTLNSGKFRELSPFVLSALPAKNLENLWQFSKVYEKYTLNGEPTARYYEWRDWGFNQTKAYRYPMGKGAAPLYSLWQGNKLNYIEARKSIYIPEYARNVVKTTSYNRLEKVYHNHPDNLVLLDFDAYDHQALVMSLTDVINNQNRKMGHAFVLMGLLTREITV